MEAYRTTGLVSLFLLLFWLLIPGHIHGQQTSEQEKYHVDSTLFVYYQHCKTEIKSPSVMQMLDTLFLMAKEKGDLRMQAVAISSKTDHFYFGPSFEGQEDSLILYTNAIKDFARKTNQPQYCWQLILLRRRVGFLEKRHGFAVKRGEFGRIFTAVYGGLGYYLWGSYQPFGHFLS